MQNATFFSKQRNTKPLMVDVGITALVPDAWGGPWESRHQILTRLSKYFNVVWVNPVGWWNEAWFGDLEEPSNELYKIRHLQGFMVYDKSYFFPYFGKAWLDYASEYSRLFFARQMLRNKGANKHVLYLWRDKFFSALQRGRYDVSCYHIDDEYSFSAVEQPLSNKEINVIKSVDQVFISSSTLMERKGAINPHTIQVPNGVDSSAFSTPCPEPDDMSEIPKPRIGYVGVIKRQLDVDMLLDVARIRSDWSFVFVGPLRTDLRGDQEKWDALAQLKNVFLLGEKPVSELPAYTQHMDVCMLCYKRNDYTKYIYPLKLHEYLAAGRPIVGSPLESLRQFQDYIGFAETSNQWIEALEKALKMDSQGHEKIISRQNMAMTHDWEALVIRIASEICARLGPKYKQRWSELLKDQE